ncbi:TPA: SmdA family multidrug ABC transporter permease/ATP-binding protein [Citrobacter murliniae]
MKILTQLRWFFVLHWKRYSGAVIILVIITFLQLLPPTIVGMIVDEGVHHQVNRTTLIIWISLIAGLALAIYILHYIWRVLLFGASYYLATVLRNQLYQRFSHQPAGFYQRYRTGDLIARTTSDVDKVAFAAGEGIFSMVDTMVTGGAVLVIMIVQCGWQLTLFSLIPLPVMAFCIKHYRKALHQSFSSAQTAFSSLNDDTLDCLTGIRLIKAFGLENHQSALFAETAARAGKQNMRVARINALFAPTIYLAVACSNLLAVGAGCWMISHDLLTPGKLTSFIMYLGLMIWPMLALSWMSNIIERGNVAYERISVLLKEAPAVLDGPLELPAGRGVLEVNIRYFNYPVRKGFSLNNIFCCLEPGKKLGICGPTGAGKSTLLALIQRHFDISEGNIRYHSIPVDKINLNEWRARLSVVNQTAFLFSATIAENIALGNPQATQKEIEYAANLACIHQDILDLAQGYQTQVGERGVRLSGGQKQRIAIARALLMNSEILILDSALSSVDIQTESQILQNIRLWGKERSLIICTHRLSGLLDASEILVLQEGYIAQRGKHDELVAKSGWYQNMFRYQQLETMLDS